MTKSILVVFLFGVVWIVSGVLALWQSCLFGHQEKMEVHPGAGAVVRCQRCGDTRRATEKDVRGLRAAAGSFADAVADTSPRSPWEGDTQADGDG